MSDTHDTLGHIYGVINPETNTKWKLKLYRKVDDVQSFFSSVFSFDTVEEAVKTARTMRVAGEIEEFSLNIGDPFETTVTEETLVKVYTAFQKLQVPRQDAIKIVAAILDEGIVFRERAE